MYFKPLLFCSALLASSIVFAENSKITMPSACPSTVAIQTTGIDFAEPGDHGTWVVAKFNVNYDTQDAWTFAMVGIPANNQDDAFEKGRNAMASLSKPKGPVDLRPRMEAWACMYRTKEGYTAFTITPPIGPDNKLFYSIKG